MASHCEEVNRNHADLISQKTGSLPAIATKGNSDALVITPHMKRCIDKK